MVSSGVISFTSGSNTATLTFNADGSATAGGSATGTLSAADVQSAFSLNTSACVPVPGQSGG